jgi:hypothetical protein
MTDRLRLINWIPRILNIALIIFFLLLSIEGIGNIGSLGTNAGNFFMFISPALLLLLILTVSWRYPMAGGIILPVLALVLAILESGSKTAINPLILPVLITGLLYWLSYRVTRPGD